MSRSLYPASHDAFKACYKCTRPWKKPGCHDHCKDYLAEKKANDERNRAEKEKRDVDGYLNRLDHQRDFRYSRIKRK